MQTLTFGQVSCLFDQILSLTDLNAYKKRNFNVKKDKGPYHGMDASSYLIGIDIPAFILTDSLLPKIVSSGLVAC